MVAPHLPLLRLSAAAAPGLSSPSCTIRGRGESGFLLQSRFEVAVNPPAPLRPCRGRHQSSDKWTGQPRGQHRS